MSYSVVLHNIIQKYNILQDPTKKVNLFLRAHPSLYKAALLANHIFRAIVMAAFCFVLPFSLPVNLAICFTASLFYRLTVETNCAYKFALPAFAGSLQVPLSLKAVTYITQRVAFQSLKSFACTTLYLAPLVAYMTYIVLTVNYDVDH
jgi:hypothetical protein